MSDPRGPQTLEDYPGLFYHRITDPTVLATLDQLRAAFQGLAEAILTTCPQNRYRSLAMTDLEAAEMRAVQAVGPTCGGAQARPPTARRPHTRISARRRTIVCSCKRGATVARTHVPPGSWKPPRVSSAMPGPDGPPPSRAVERVSCARGHAPPRGPSAVPLPPSTLRNVIPADLSDVARLLALHQHAIARGWLKGGEAAQLNAVAAAVHARRVGEAPCRLFVALLRDQRWEVITQEDEDQARRLLREHRDGPPPRTRTPAAMPEVSLSDDARFVQRAAQVLRQAGWQGEPFLGVKLVDPTWTRARWGHAQAALAQWQKQQGRARGQGSGLEPLGDAPDEVSKADEDD
jgi:hypothetical protein